MAVGFIQLIFTGTEKYLLNVNPDVTFFKIYYRRYSNFYIQNYLINGNTKSNNLISFDIPTAGDLLYKNYLKINIPKQTYELFSSYPTLYNTLNIDILNFYDSYSIKSSTFIKQNINVMKKNKINVKYNNKAYFKIFCDYELYPEYLDSIKNGFDIYLDIDEKYYCNINEYYYFYSFDYDNSLKLPIYDIPFITPIINSINFSKMLYLRIDIKFLKLSVKIFNTKFFYDNFKNIVYLFLNNINHDSLIENTMFVGANNIYISFSINNNIIDTIINLIYNISTEIKINFIEDNLTQQKIYIKKSDSIDFKKEINNLFLVSKKYVVYFDININTITEIVLTIMKNSPVLGNITNIDFNNFLIEKETNIISATNLYSYINPTNLFIKIIVFIICNKDIEPTLPNFIKIIINNSINRRNRLISKWC